MGREVEKEGGQTRQGGSPWESLEVGQFMAAGGSRRGSGRAAFSPSCYLH